MATAMHPQPIDLAAYVQVAIDLVSVTSQDEASAEIANAIARRVGRPLNRSELVKVDFETAIAWNSRDRALQAAQDREDDIRRGEWLADYTECVQ